MELSVNNLMKQSPDYVLDWLEKVSSENIDEYKSFNWLGLAQSAAFQTTLESPIEDDKQKIQWARVSILVYNLLASKIDQGSRDSYDHSAMMLRASMISIYGAEAGHQVLDPNVVAQWFFDRLSMTLEEATQLSINWQTLPIDQIKQLRYIKLRLSVVNHLLEDGHLEEYVNLHKWIKIKDKLP